MEDNIKRNFIFVTLPEPIDDSTQAGKNAKVLGCKSIADVARLRIVKAIDKIKSEIKLMDIAQIDLGFKHLICSESNFKIWHSEAISSVDDLKSKLGLFQKSQKDTATDFDMVFELIIKNGLDLNAEINEMIFVNTLVYSINNNNLFIVTKPINEIICTAIKKFNPKSIICLDSIFNNNDCVKTNIQLQFEDAGISFKTI